MNITYLLVLMQRIGKMHEQKLKELCRQYDLSLIEATDALKRECIPGS